MLSRVSRSTDGDGGECGGEGEEPEKDGKDHADELQGRMSLPYGCKGFRWMGVDSDQGRHASCQVFQVIVVVHAVGICM